MQQRLRLQALGHVKLKGVLGPKRLQWTGMGGDGEGPIRIHSPLARGGVLSRRALREPRRGPFEGPDGVTGLGARRLRRLLLPFLLHLPAVPQTKPLSEGGFQNVALALAPRTFGSQCRNGCADGRRPVLKMMRWFSKWGSRLGAADTRLAML